MEMNNTHIEAQGEQQELNYETAIEEVSTLAAKLDNVAAGREAALDLIALTSNIISAGHEVEAATAKSIALSANLTAKQFGMINTTHIDSACESEGSTLGVVGAAGEGAKEMLITAWEYLKSLIAKAGAAITKLYTSAMSAIRGLDKRATAVEKGIKDLKGPKMDKIDANEKDIIKMRKAFALHYVNVGFDDTKLLSQATAEFKTNVDTTKIVYKAITDVVDQLLADIKTEDKDVKEATIARAIAKALRPYHVPGNTELIKALGAGSKIGAFLSDSSQSDKVAISLRLDGTTAVFLAVAVKNGKLVLTLIKDTASKITMERIGRKPEKAKLPEPDEVKTVIKDVMKVKEEKFDKGVTKIEEAIKKLEEKIKDPKKRSIGQVNSLITAKNVLTKLAAVQVSFARETVRYAYNTKLSTIIAAEYCLKEYEANDRKKKKKDDKEDKGEKKASGEEELITDAEIF